MIVLATFILAMVFSAVHFSLSGTIVYGDISIYKLAMVTVIGSGLIACIFHKTPLEYVFALILITLSTTIGWNLWDLAYPVLSLSILHFIIAALLAIFSFSRSCLAVSALFLLNVVFGVVQVTGLIPSRGSQFTGLYFPDLLAMTNYLSIFVLSWGSGDAGRRIRNFFDTRVSLVVDGRRNIFSWFANI